MKTTGRIKNSQLEFATDAIAGLKSGQEKNHSASEEMPNAKSNNQAAAPAADALARPQAIPGRKETILIVDDEVNVRELVEMILRQHHYQVLSAPSGVEALKIWEQHHEEIDLLLTDMILPGGLPGGELAAVLKRRKPGLKIIFTSGYSPELIGKDLPVGGVAFLPKPYRPSHLAQTVRQCLDGTLKIKAQRVPILDDDVSGTTATSQ